MMEDPDRPAQEELVVEEVELEQLEPLQIQDRELMEQLVVVVHPHGQEIVQ